MIRHLPNFLTCCNLLCGALGVFAIFDFGEPSEVFSWSYFAAGFVWVACVFDFLDGFVARKLNVTSPIGKELDSLADVVSFGLLPSACMFVLIRDQLSYFPEFQNIPFASYLPFAALLIVVFSALRLAIFNVDETQKDSFRGLPTPANALLITALPFLDNLNLILSPWSLLIITIGSCWLLVSRIELFALKFKNFTWTDNKLRFTFLILSVSLLAILRVTAIPIIVILYILLSLGDKAFRGRNSV